MKPQKNPLELIDSWSDREKAGHLFMLAFPGKDPGVSVPLIREYNLAGCYLSQDNAETFAEARSLCAALNAAGEERAGAPLILGVDQEGAWGVLVGESTTGPGNMALGAAPVERTEELYEVFGAQMLAAGFNCLLAPCADVNTDPESPIIGTRSFGEDPREVSARVRAALRGAARTGIATTLKHFPGHGGTKGDSHRDLPLVDKDLAALRREDFLPFAEGISAGVDIVMTSHIRYPALDPDNPATMSKVLLEDLLRKELGFQGVILSDSMNMGAIRKNYDGGEAAVRALEAGVDLVMLSEEHYDHSATYLERQLASVRAVEAAIASGRLGASLVRAKLERVLALRLRLAAVEVRRPDFDAARRAEDRAAREALSLLKRKGSAWPIGAADRVGVVNATPRGAYTLLKNPRGIGPNQGEAAFDAFWEEARSLRPDLVQMKREKFLADPETVWAGLDKLIVVTEDHPLPGQDFPQEEQTAVVNAALSTGADRTLVVGLRSPYETSRYRGLGAYFCAFSGRPCSARAAARAVLSGDPGTGVSPVSVLD